jgi:hypothetical protein
MAKVRFLKHLPKFQGNLARYIDIFHVRESGTQKIIPFLASKSCRRRLIPSMFMMNDLGRFQRNREVDVLVIFQMIFAGK